MSPPERRREFATEVVRRLRQAGYQALWAGGCVRDLILGLSPSDYDVATDATPEQVMGLFRYRTVPVGRRVRGGPGAEPARPGRRGRGRDLPERRRLRRRPPPRVGRLQLAPARRRAARLHDQWHVPRPVHRRGHRLRRGPGRPRTAASSAPSATPRRGSARTSSGCSAPSGSRPRFEMTIEPATALGPRRDGAAGPRSSRPSGSRRSSGGCSCTRRRAEAMDLALETGLVAAVCPRWFPMKGIFQGKPMQPEGDLWDHTMLVLEAPAARPELHPGLRRAPARRRQAADASRSTTAGCSFHNHEQVGRQIADRTLPRAQALERRARADHLAGRIPPVPRRGQAAPRGQAQAHPRRCRGSRSCSPCTAPTPWPRSARRARSTTASFTSRPSPPVRSTRRPLVTGHDLARHGLSPGAHFSDLLDQIREAQLDRIINSKREALEWLDRRLALVRQEGQGKAQARENGRSAEGR